MINTSLHDHFPQHWAKELHWKRTEKCVQLAVGSEWQLITVKPRTIKFSKWQQQQQNTFLVAPNTVGKKPDFFPFFLFFFLFLLINFFSFVFDLTCVSFNCARNGQLSISVRRAPRADCNWEIDVQASLDSPHRMPRGQERRSSTLHPLLPGANGNGFYCAIKDVQAPPLHGMAGAPANVTTRRRSWGRNRLRLLTESRLFRQFQTWRRILKESLFCWARAVRADTMETFQTCNSKVMNQPRN